MKILISCFLALACHSSLFAQIPDWYNQIKQIRFFETNQKELETILQKPSETFRRKYDVGIEKIHYETSDFDVSADFTLGNCTIEDEKNSLTLIKKGYLIKIVFFLKKPVKFSTLKLKKKKMGRATLGDPGIHYYSSDGFVYYDAGYRRITRINISPDLRRVKIICNGENIYPEGY